MAAPTPPADPGLETSASRPVPAGRRTALWPRLGFLGRGDREWARGDGNGQARGDGRSGRGGPDGAVWGRARVDRRTKDLVARLLPGEIAVIDHLDLDRVAAEGLIRAGARAVVNASRSISGRYPNLGPLLIVAAGIPLIDDVGPGIVTAIVEGRRVEVKGAAIRVDGAVVATGTRHTLESLEAQIEVARHAVGEELERFAENTLEYLRQERHLVTDSLPLPDLATSFAGRHVLIVVRGGQDAAADLAALKSYISEMQPVIIGVDGGADVVLDAGHRPDLVVGDFDSVSTEALLGRASGGLVGRRAGRPELLVHAYPDGAAPGAARLESLGLPFVTFEAPGTSEDVAMLIAFEKGAELIVAVGTHASMVEFLDKGRAGMASTFLVRLKVGPILVDAKGVSRLYRSRVRTSDMVLLVSAAVFSMLVMVLVFSPLHVFAKAILFTLGEAWRALVSGYLGGG